VNPSIPDNRFICCLNCNEAWPVKLPAKGNQMRNWFQDHPSFIRLNGDDEFLWLWLSQLTEPNKSIHSFSFLKSRCYVLTPIFLGHTLGREKIIIFRVNYQRSKIFWKKTVNFSLFCFFINDSDGLHHVKDKSIKLLTVLLIFPLFGSSAAWHGIRRSRNEAEVLYCLLASSSNLDVKS
jgi:hypothetical protein